MRQDENASLRSGVVRFMEEHPVSFEIAERHILQRSKEYYSRSWLSLLYKPMASSIVIALVVVLGGSGLSVAAEGALPGEPLYAVKIHVNENIRSTFNTSIESKANWEVKRTERRLEEAEVLAAQGKLDSKTSAEISENFAKQAERASETIRVLETKGRINTAAQVSSEMETSLSAHTKILGTITAKKDTTKAQDTDETNTAEMKTKASKDPEDRFLEGVKIKARQAAETRTKMERKVSSGSEAELKVSAGKRKKAVEAKISEVTKFIALWESRLGAEAVAGAEAELKTASNVVAEGQAKFEVGAYAEAFALFQKAHRIAQNAKLLLEAKKDFKIDFDIRTSLPSAEASGEVTGGSDGSVDVVETKPADTKDAKSSKDEDENDKEVEDSKPVESETNPNINVNININGRIPLLPKDR